MGRHARAAGAGVAIVSLLAALVATASLTAQDDRERVPHLPVPAPINAALTRPATDPLRLTVRDLAFRLPTGARVRVPLAEAVGPPPSGDVIRADLVRIVGLDVFVPPDTVTTGFDAFIGRNAPRFEIGRVVLQGARARGQRTPAEWLYRFEDLDIDLRDVRIGGDGPPEYVRLARLDFTGEVAGEALAVTRATAEIHRTAAQARLDGSFRFGVTTIRTGLRFTQAGAIDALLDIDTVRFAEMRAFADGLPAIGGGRGRVEVRARPGSTAIDVPGFTALLGESRLSLRGRITTGENGAAHSVALESSRLRSADLDAAFGVALPGGGDWHGLVTADGPLRTGVRVHGEIEQVRLAGAAPARITLRGTVRGGPGALDLALDAGPLRLADTLVVAALHASGPFDSVHVRGGVALAGADAVTADAGVRVASATDAGPTRTGDVATGEVAAEIDGSVALTGSRTLDIALAVDSLPLAILPWPGPVRDVTGHATATGHVSGSLDDPALRARVDLVDGGMLIDRADIRVTDLHGPIVLEDEVVRIDALTAAAGRGRIEFAGGARLFGDDPRVDAQATLIDVGIGGDTARLSLDGALTANGPFDAVAASGELRLRERSPTRVPGRAVAFASGSAMLRKDGELRADVRADSLPLRLLPIPDEQVSDVHGAARADVRVRGTIEAPEINGELLLRDAGFRVVRTGMYVDSLTGPVRINDGIVQVDSIHGTAGGGRVVLAGEVALQGEKRLALRMRLDTVAAMDTDSARVVASALLDAAGTLAAPRVTGEVRIHEGRVYEAQFTPSEPLDVFAPPYAELVDEVPWVSRSRLRAGATRPLATEESQVQEAPALPEAALAAQRAQQRTDAARDVALTADVTLHVEPGFSIIDEDSDMYGMGTIALTYDSAGARASGVYRILGGEYNNFGERFSVIGGAFHFGGDGLEPAASLRAEHDIDAPLGAYLGSSRRVSLEKYPLIEVFAQGSGAAARQEVRWPALMPYSQTEIGALLLYGVEPEPVTGLRNRPFWLDDEGADMVSKRAEAQNIAVLWGYVADEAYDYIPIGRAYLRAGIVAINPEYPARMFVSPLMRGTLRFGNLEALASIVPQGGTYPGLRLRYRLGDALLLAFTEPHYRGAISGYAYRRRTGIGLRWEW